MAAWSFRNTAPIIDDTEALYIRRSTTDPGPFVFRPGIREDMPGPILIGAIGKYEVHLGMSRQEQWRLPQLPETPCSAQSYIEQVVEMTCSTGYR